MQRVAIAIGKGLTAAIAVGIVLLAFQPDVFFWLLGLFGVGT